jgi:hypothetical protein
MSFTDNQSLPADDLNDLKDIANKGGWKKIWEWELASATGSATTHNLTTSARPTFDFGNKMYLWKFSNIAVSSGGVLIKGCFFSNLDTQLVNFAGSSTTGNLTLLNNKVYIVPHLYGTNILAKGAYLFNDWFSDSADNIKLNFNSNTVITSFKFEIFELNFTGV